MEFPQIITRLPQADLPIPGLRAYMLRSEHGLIAFFEALEDTEIPPHAHKDQWGTVLEGQVEFTVGGETRTVGPGESYFVPGGVVHSARVPAGAKLLEFFEESDRFREKPTGDEG